MSYKETLGEIRKKYGISESNSDTSAYKETLGEIRKKYGISESGGDTSAYKSGGSRQEDTYHATLNSILEKYSKPPAGADRFNSMISDYNSFLDDTKKDYDTVDWGNSGELSEKNISRISELGSAAKDLFQYYLTGDGRNEVFSDQNRGQLQEIMNNLRDMGSDWKNTGDYYRQWEDEDSWNEYKKITGLQEKYNWHTTPELETALEGMPAGEDKDYLSILYNAMYQSEQQENGWLDRDAPYDQDAVSARQGYYSRNQERIRQIEEQIRQLQTGEVEPQSVWEMLGNAAQNAALGISGGPEAKGKNQDEIANLEREKANLEAQNRQYEYIQKIADEKYGLTQESGFWESKRDYGLPTGQEGEIIDRLGLYHTAFDDPAIHERLYPQYNGSPDPWNYERSTLKGVQKYGEGYLTVEDAVRRGVENDWDQLTDTEVALYYYLLQNQGQEAADKYLDDMSSTLGYRATKAETEAIENAGTGEKILYNVASVPANVLGGPMAFADDAARLLQGKEINPYSRGHALTNFATEVRSSTAEDIVEGIGSDTAFQKTVGQLAANTYQGIMSGVDSAVGAMTMGTGYTVAMGMGAASQRAKELYEGGASKEQMMVGALGSGILEALFEYVSIDKFTKNFMDQPIAGWKDFVGKTLAQGGVEASEEVNTELANMLWDALVMGAGSEDNQQIYKLMEKGLTQDQAKKQVILQNAQDVFWAAYGGFVSGAGMGTVGAGIKEIGMSPVYNDYKQTYDGYSQALVDEAVELDPKSKITQNAQNTLQNGKDLSGRQIHNLVYNNEQAIAAQDKAAIQTAAQNRLTELGETGDVAKISAALAKQAAGEQLNRPERRAIQFSKYGNRVAAELNPANSLSGDYSSDWTGRIGTSRLNPGIYNRAAQDTQTPQEAEPARNEPVPQEMQNPAQAVTADAVEQISAETFYAVSDNGEATQLSTGETVQIQEVAEAGEDGMRLRMEDGSLVDADDIGYASREDALLYESVADLGADAPAANALIRTYKSIPGNVSVADYTAGMAEAFYAGQHHVPISQLARDPLASKLTDAQRNAVYAAGRNYGRRASAAKEESVKQSAGKTPKTSKSEGKVHFDWKGRTFSEAQETGIKTMEILSKAIGTEFYVFESYEKDGVRVYRDENGKEKPAPNGFYDPKTGAIHIDLNAGSGGRGTVLFTLSHELTHFIRQWSPAKFDALAEAVISMIYDQKNINVKERIQAQQAKAQQAGITLTEDEAYEEMIADSMETILRDGNVLNELMDEIKQKDATLWEKIKQWFQDLAENIRRIMDAYEGYDPDSYEGRAVASMEGYLEILEGFYVDALSTAGENYRGAKDTEKNAVGEDSKKQNSFRGYAEDGKGIYESNFPKGTPKRAKSERILRYIQDVWSKKPITLRVEGPNGVRYIEAKFDPTYDSKDGMQSDASKLMGGNRHGSSSEQRVTLDLADDYYQIASESVYNYSKPEEGKTTGPHQGVNQWHYFVNDIYFSEYGSSTAVPYRVSINVKEKANGHFFYSFSAEKTEGTSTPRTLHAVVSSGTETTTNGNSLTPSIRNSEGDVKKKFSLRDSSDGKSFIEDKYFARQMDKWDKLDAKKVRVGTIMKGNALNRVGLPASGLYFDVSKIKTEMEKHEDHLDKDILKRIPSMLDNPVVISEYRGPSGKIKNTVSVYGNLFYNNHPIVVGIVMRLDRSGQNVISNIRTIHARGNFFKNITDDSVLYLNEDKKMTRNWFQVCGISSVPLEGTRFGLIRSISFDRGNVNEKFSLRDEDYSSLSYSEISQKQSELHQREIDLQERKRKAENAPELLEAVDRYHSLFDEWKKLLPKKKSGVATQEELDRIDEIKTLRNQTMEEIGNIQDKLGLNEIAKEEAEIKTIREVLRKASDEAWAREGAEKENKAIAKSGLSPAEYFRNKAVKAFHYTTNFNEAGYLLPNGKLLNFSGGERNHRYRDHREIGEIYETTQGVHAMNRFMSDGNIRIMAESPGIDLTNGVSPTTEQYAALRKYINSNGVKSGKFFVDFSDAEGHEVGNYSYQGKISADRVINDIKYFYQTGETRAQSSVAEFLSLRDTVQEKSVKSLQKENDRLREDISRLKELVKLQGKLTYGKLFSESYIEDTARSLKKLADAKGDTRELAGLLRKMYTDIAGGPEINLDRLEAAAKPVVDWLWGKKQSHMDPYAESILNDMKGRKVMISPQQAGDMFSTFESIQEYKKRLSGTVRVVPAGTEGAMDLDSFWQEMSDAYPGTFDAEISDAGMAVALADIVGRLQSLTSKDYEQESPEVQDAMRQELFYDVYETFWQAKTTQTVADKMQREIDSLNEKHEQQIRDLKKDHKETVSQLKKAKADSLKELRENTRKSQEVKKYRRSIEKKAKKLMDALAKNSDKEHIPEALKSVVGDFLNSIDFSSKSLMEKGTPTKRDVSYTEALGRLQEVLQKQENLVNGVEDSDLLNDYFMDLPTGFAQAVQEHIKKVTSAAKGLDTTTNQVFAMGAEELQDLDYILTVITKSVSQMNKLLANAHFQTAAEAAQTSIREFKELGKDKSRGKAAGGAYRFLQWHNATPFYVFKRMGEGAQSVFEGLQDGWDRLAFNAQAIIDFAEETYTAKEVKDWTEDVKTLELSSGEKIRLTTAQLMSIYCLSHRKQGMQHLLGGGIRVGDFEIKQKTGKAQVSDAENYTLTIGDVAMLNDLLSDRQKAVADKLQKYMNTVGTKWGNEVSMKRFGYQAFTEENYFPIQSDSNNRQTLNTDTQNANNLYRLLNLSMTKSLTPKANNAVVIGSVFDVFADHMSDMAKYNALALPVLDAMKWYNYKTQTKNENGQVDAVAVKKSMESAFGKSANSYFMNLIKDINGTNEGGKGTDRLSRKMISNYKVAAVAGNLRVALLQPTAYVRATAVLNAKYLIRGLAVNPVKAAQEAEKYSGIAAWKSMGFYDTGIARGIREQIKHDTGVKDMLVEKSMKAAEWGDRLTWGVLWNACKQEVQDTQHLTGDALMEATSKRFRDVVYRTQVVDSTMTRSQSMRDTGGLSVFTTAFMAEPTLSYNMLLDAYSDYANEVRRTGDKGAAWGKAKNVVIRTLVSYTLTNLAAALAEGLMDAWRDDDEYETFLEKFLEHFKDNFRDDMNPLTKLPVVKDVLSYLDGYDNSRMDTEWLKNLADVYSIWAETIALKAGAQEKATSVTYNGNMPFYGKLYKTLKAMSQAVGMPFSNTMREVASFWNNTFGVITGNKLRTYDPGPASQIKYAYLDGFLTQEEATQELLKLGPDNGGAKNADDAYFKIQSWETNKGKYTALDTALQQDQSIDAAVKDLTSHGIKPEEIQSHIKSTVGGWYKDNAISRDQATAMLKKNTDLDSTVVVAKWDWDIQYPEYADLSEAAVSRFHSAGVSAEVYYDACKFLANATGDKDANGNTISGSKKEKVMKYIASLDIPNSQKDSLWNAIKGSWKGSWR